MTHLARFTQSQSPLRLLALGASASAAIYALAFTLPYSLLRYYDTPRLDLGKLTQHSQSGALLFVISFALLFAIYIGAYLLLRDSPADTRLTRLVLSAPLLFMLLMLLTYPFGAIDVYDYIFHGRMLVHYQVNPLIVAPQKFGDDAWLRFVGWPHETSPYGPLWLLLSQTLYTLVGDDLLRNLLAYKVVAAASLWLGAGVVYLTLRAWRPREALSGFLLIAWNPLLLSEVAANAHNDALMALGIVLSLYFYQRRRLTLAVLALVLGMLVKLPALLLLPVIGLGALRQLPSGSARAEFAARTALAALVVIALAYAPYWAGLGVFANLVNRQDLFTASLPAVARLLLQPALPDEFARQLARQTSLIAFVCASALLLVKLKPRFESLAQSAFALMTLSLMVATLWFQPWYLLWTVPLAPLAGQKSRLLALMFSWSAVWAYFLFDFAWLWDQRFFNQGNTLVLNLTAVLIIFGPPIAYMASQALAAPARSQWPS